VADAVLFILRKFGYGFSQFRYKKNRVVAEAAAAPRFPDSGHYYPLQGFLYRVEPFLAENERHGADKTGAAVFSRAEFGKEQGVPFD
jgi:hypothetical protein